MVKEEVHFVKTFYCNSSQFQAKQYLYITKKLSFIDIFSVRLFKYYEG